MNGREILQPGGTIGILGGGQLGRMAAVEARRAGYRVVILTNEEPGSPAGQVADQEINAQYDDPDACERFLRCADAVTMEFENLPSDLLERLESRVRVRPGRAALEIGQHREREKRFLERHGIPVADFAVAADAAELKAAVGQIGFPCVVKTAAFGYDGKGQQKLQGGEDLTEVWSRLGAERAVVERWITFEREISVVCARSDSGEFAAFPAVENMHAHHILDVSLSPARISPAAAREAVELARAVADALQYTGTLAVEMFLTSSGSLLVNELAPRPHNSGHHTIESCLTNQFAQQIRTVAGLPPGDPRQHTPVAMVNLLGDLWPGPAQLPDWSPVLRHPRAHLHLYGKRHAAPRRKMGHFTVLAETIGEAYSEAAAIQAKLREGALAGRE